MHRPLFISEVLDRFVEDGQERELCATSEARYDATQEKVAVDLDAFVRPVELCGKEWHVRPEWLLRPHTVTEGVPEEEAAELSREIFQRWVVRLRPVLNSHREVLAAAGT